MRILIINGPNLDILGKREPKIYGTTTLSDIEKRLKKKFPKVKLEFYQSNSEGPIIDALHTALDGSVNGVVLNPGAFTHYSYAIRDAAAAVKVPVIEVHLSNVDAREEFRRVSVTAPVCKGVIAGFGVRGYELAVELIINQD
ncbi:MAG: type II 3-dehydroquinate dehydratase [Bacteroidetes bacterium]|nr:type II 3-dehydroquinate dehydratase [Bacteroidota bacterium]